MPNPIILKEFWYDLTDTQRNIILTNCQEEYNNFLQGKPFNPELINKYFKVDNKKFIHHAKEGNLELVKIYIQLGANIHAKNRQTLMHLLPHISITILLLLYSIVYIAIILH